MMKNIQLYKEKILLKNIHKYQQKYHLQVLVGICQSFLKSSTSMKSSFVLKNINPHNLNL